MTRPVWDDARARAIISASEALVRGDMDTLTGLLTFLRGGRA